MAGGIPRTYVEDIKARAGGTVRLQGWVYVIRDQGKLKFLLLRDITGVVQLVIKENNTAAMRQSDTLHLESVVEVAGTAKAEKQAPGGIEVVVETLKVLSEPDPSLPIPVFKKGHEETDINKRLDWRWLDLRQPEKALIFKVWTTMEQAFRAYWTAHNFIEIHSPKIMSTPSEGGAELFAIDYFGRKAYLAQSPQFYKQMAMAAGFEKVFETGPVFRANPSFTSRHDTEFTGYDMELSFIDSHHDVMAEQEQLLVSVLAAVKKAHGEAIKTLYGRELVVPKTPFPKLTMAEAKTVLKQRKIPSERDGDLSPEEERALSAYIKETKGHEFVYVTDYPKSVRPFYHMRHEKTPDLTKSFDLLWDGLEITTGAQREHRPEALAAQAKEARIPLSSIAFYLEFFKYGCPPHGGFGLGPSRMLLKVFNLENVREVTFLFRGVKRITP